MKTININLLGFSSNKSVGTLVYSKRLFKQINLISDTDYHFIYYAQKNIDLKDFCLPTNAEIIRLPNIKSALFRRLYEHIVYPFKLKKADYIFTPYLTIPFLFTAAKQYVTIHDMVPYVVSGKYGKLKMFLIKLETKLASLMADKIITVSNNSKNDICSITAIENDKVEVIYNFITDSEPVIQNKSNNKELEELLITKPYFVTVATLHPGKNVERLLRSFRLFIDKNPNYQLVIVGNKGWGFKTIYENVKSLRLEFDVIFTGYASDDTLDNLYSNCFGVVFVSLYEGFGFTPLEGFYHNKPAVVSINSSLPEVVGDAAIKVDPYDEKAIANGLSDFINQYEYLQKHIPKQIAKFNPVENAKLFLKLFE